MSMGAGSAGFARACTASGLARVVSLDAMYDLRFCRTQSTEQLEGIEAMPHGLAMVKARAECMPFPDEIFDFVVALTAAPITCRTKEDVFSAVEEMCRVVRRGGETRIMPIRRYAECELNKWVEEKIFLLSQDGQYRVREQELVREGPFMPKTHFPYGLCVIQKV